MVVHIDLYFNYVRVHQFQQAYVATMLVFYLIQYWAEFGKNGNANVISMCVLACGSRGQNVFRYVLCFDALKFRIRYLNSDIFFIIACDRAQEISVNPNTEQFSKETQTF